MLLIIWESVSLRPGVQNLHRKRDLEQRSFYYSFCLLRSLQVYNRLYIYTKGNTEIFFLLILHAV